MRWPRPEGAAALLGVLLAGCAGGPPPGGAHGPAAHGPGSATVEMRFARPGGVLRRRLEVLAARCWLDGELGAEALAVDRRSGRIVAAGPEGALFTLDVEDAPAGAALVRLSGPALADPARRARMARALETVLVGPEPSCRPS